MLLLMRYRPLGSTGLVVSELGMGCAGLWARPLIAETEAVDLVHRAVEAGVTFFDTGAHYGRSEAERRLGKALRSHRSVELIVGTKAGTVVGRRGRLYKDFTATTIRRSVEGSLRRLGLDHLQVLHLHGPRPADLTDELLECLESLVDDGLVAVCGINGFSPALVRMALRYPVVSTMMFDYNLMCPERQPYIAELVAGGVAFVAATPLAQGHYSARVLRPKRVADLWYLARALGRNRDAVRRGTAFRFVNEVPGWTGAQVALAFVLSNPNVSAAVFGTTRLVHLDENVAACGRPLPAGLATRLGMAGEA